MPNPPTNTSFSVSLCPALTCHLKLFHYFAHCSSHGTAEVEYFLQNSEALVPWCIFCRSTANVHFLFTWIRFTYVFIHGWPCIIYKFVLFLFQLDTLIFFLFTFTNFLHMFRTDRSIIRRIKCFITQAASGTVPSVVDVSCVAVGVRLKLEKEIKWI